VTTASAPSSASNSQVISHPNPVPPSPGPPPALAVEARAADLKPCPRYDIADTARFCYRRVDYAL